jgi:hypothetical protein
MKGLVMSSGINDLMDRISRLEETIKRNNPKQKGRVMIANAKSTASYEIDRKDEFRWAIAYYEELKKLI